ncbi:hypothetical protein [Sphingomonas baiyangensis]|uniref:Secreted protein n=1 Tax=Sphingomonas baiyangensis TaxID=2572576 RepID=A0A4V5PTZ0_9SPHN|nr:hypothetical protein [Sphingomonas baiyangensis]TKD51958.1 hypothetical protein FBR43_15310 [Sphingomonas baiyangensis]
MRKFLAPALIAMMALPLAACGGDGDDALAERVEDNAEERADAAEANGATDAQADAIEDAGEARADAIDDADVNAHAMSNEQKLDLITNDQAVVPQ